MAEVKDLSATDASNTARFPESQLPSTVNNGARALEGMIARFNQDTNGSVTSSGTNTVTLAAASVLSAYAQGDRFMFKAGGTNTGAVTLNVDSVGAKAVQKNQAALEAGDITQNDIVHVVYDGTQFQMVSPPKVPVGFGTGDSPQFTGIELGHASDTTLTRTSSGDVDIEGNIIYRAGGTDVPVADGGTGASTLTDGGVLLGSGTGAITAMSVLADGEMIVGDGTTDPVAESGATLRTSIGVGTGDNVQFTNCVLTGNLDVQGTTTTIDTTNMVVNDSLIELSNGSTSASNDAGVVVERGSTGNNAIVAWDESADAWIVGTTTATGASTGNLTIAAAPFSCAALTATTITGSTSIALASGATVTGINDTDAMSDASATTLATSESIKAYSDANVKAPGIQMTFETNTADADQGQGKVHANNSDLSSATVLFIDDLANDGTSINSFVDTLDDPTATNSALIYLQEAGTGTAGVIYQVSGAVTSASTYSKVAVTHVATFGTLADGDIIGMMVAYSGDNGSFIDPMSTRGDIMVRDASNATARLGVGSANTVLKSDGTDVAYSQVSGAMIANDAIDSQHYADGSIDTAHIAASQVTGPKLGGGVIGAVGFSATTFDLGTNASGTETLDESNGNFQKGVNGGAHTLAPQSNDSTIVVQYTNNASAGTLTVSGFDTVTGDSLTTTNGHDFLMFSTVIGSFQNLNVVALQ